MAVTPAVFYKFGRRSAEKYVARKNIDRFRVIDPAPEAARPEPAFSGA
jgi:hypothetical protein